MLADNRHVDASVPHGRHTDRFPPLSEKKNDLGSNPPPHVPSEDDEQRVTIKGLLSSSGYEVPRAPSRFSSDDRSPESNSCSGSATNDSSATRAAPADAFVTYSVSASAPVSRTYMWYTLRPPPLHTRGGEWVMVGSSALCHRFAVPLFASHSYQSECQPPPVQQQNNAITNWRQSNQQTHSSTFVKT